MYCLGSIQLYDHTLKSSQYSHCVGSYYKWMLNWPNNVIVTNVCILSKFQYTYFTYI